MRRGNRAGTFTCADTSTPGRLVDRVRIVPDRRSRGHLTQVFLPALVSRLGFEGRAEMGFDAVNFRYPGVAEGCAGGTPSAERIFCGDCARRGRTHRPGRHRSGERPHPRGVLAVACETASGQAINPWMGCRDDGSDARSRILVAVR